MAIGLKVNMFLKTVVPRGLLFDPYHGPYHISFLAKLKRSNHKPCELPSKVVDTKGFFFRFTQNAVSFRLKFHSVGKPFYNSQDAYSKGSCSIHKGTLSCDPVNVHSWPSNEVYATATIGLWVWMGQNKATMKPLKRAYKKTSSILQQEMKNIIRPSDAF